MAPNADTSRLRQRFQANGQAPSEDVATLIPTTTLKHLKDNEVAIEGVVYDLDSFVHPGGGTIYMHGGNDVTVLYKMMHPYHTKHHLAKMRKVGTVPFKMEYKFDTPFEKEIKREVFKIVRRGREFGTPGYYFRAAFYISLLFGSQYAWVKFGSSITLAIIFGLAQAFIGLNVQHDGNHGAVSKNPIINDLFGFGADMIGGSKWTWLEQHTTHHAYCNHKDKDPDAISGEPFFLFNDYPLDHPIRKGYHKFQGAFFLVFLSFYWLSSVFNPQILDLNQRGSAEVGMNWDNDFVRKRRKYAIAIRVVYIYMNVITPFLCHHPLIAVFHIWLMSFVESMTLACLFSLSHNFENSDRDPTSTYDETGETVCWMKSQVETSSTYGGFVSGCLTGGLNFQVEHHLFPRMSSAWYPFIAPKVREICKKHGVRYAYYPWVYQNFISTIKYMHRVGTGENWMNPLSGAN